MPRREFNLTGLNGVNGFTINGIAAGDNAGLSSKPVGDVNGDGIDDLIIGARSADPFGRNSAGQSYLVFGRNSSWPISVELSSLNGRTGVIIDGARAIDHSGWRVASAGDINRDGFFDVLIGAHRGDPVGRNDAGQSYLIFGHQPPWPARIDLASLSGISSVVFNGIQAGDLSGWSVAFAGDMNADNISDVLISAQGASPGGRTTAGQHYLVFGRNDSWPSTVELSSLNGTTGVIINGIAAGDASPAVSDTILASFIGDMNADGVDDCIVSAANASPSSNRTSAGQAYVIFGRRGSWPATFELSALNGRNGFIVNGMYSGNNIGSGLGFVGDFSNDGIDDVFIGAYRASPEGRPGAGQSYLIFGSNASWPAVFELSSLSGANGFMINGESGSDHHGTIAGDVGDLNQDGLSDLLVSSFVAGRNRAGQCYLLYGRRNTWPSVFELSSLNQSTGLVINGINTNDNTGSYTALLGGDVNNDGADDVIIGAVVADPGGRADAGRVYTIFGGAEQFSANQIAIQSGQMIRLSQNNLAVDPVIGNRTFTVTNTSHMNFVSTYNTSQPLSSFTQQQINNGEILVIHDGSREAPSYTVSAEGITRVFSDVHPQQGNVSFTIGAPRVSAPHREFNLSSLNGVNGFAINGIAAGDQSGISVASAGDINGDGVDDVIIGAYHANFTRGQSYLIFGRVGAWPVSLELSALNGVAGVTIVGNAVGDLSGFSVAAAGDVNGDGIDDVIIGAHNASPRGRNRAGQCYIVFGQNSTWPASLELISLNGEAGVIVNGAVAGDLSGWTVSSAGDVTGDGVDDVIIGAPFASPGNRTNAGESYVIFGHRGIWPANIELFSLNSTVGIAINGISENDQSGRFVSGGKDINGDGYDDVIIGARTADPDGRVNAGQSYLIFGHNEFWPDRLELSVINTTDGVIINGVANYGRSGTAVSLSGDVNGDGYADLIVGGRRITGEIYQDLSYLVFGRNDTWPMSFELSNINGINGEIINGVMHADHCEEYILSDAGDLNGDGFNDIILGDCLADVGNEGHEQDVGQSHVIFGHDGVWSTQLGVNEITEMLGVSINGIRGRDWSGRYVATAGDINNDGFADVIIGAPQADPGSRGDAGQSYVIFGGSEQFSRNQITIQSGEMIRLNQSNLAVDPIIGNRTFTVSNTSHINFVSTYNTSQPLSNFTQQQINDGEILVIHDGSREAPSYTVSAEGITRVFSDVHPQQANVSFSIGAPRISAPNSVFELSALNGVNGFTINGIAGGDLSGYSVASAGDVNADGFDDVIIGAFNVDPGGRTDAGQSYLVFGHNGTWSASLELSTLNGTTGVTINGIAGGDRSGIFVASAGDVNGDGIGDVMIGASYANPGGRVEAGQTYVVFGRMGAWPARLELSLLNGVTGVIINGIASGDRSGRSVSSAGDVNGDSVGDMIIGAYRADPSGRVDAGQSYLIFGHNRTWPASLELSSLNGTTGVIINGIAGVDLSGYPVAAAGDVNNDAIDDVIIGAYTADPGNRTRAGQTYVVFGRVGTWSSHLELSSLNGTTGVMINGIAANDNSGVSVASAGDVNGDDIDDVIIGAYYANPDGRIQAGQSYLVFGYNGTWPARLELSSLDGVIGVIVNGVAVGDLSGLSVAAVGDVNGDNIADVVIGAYAANPGGRTDAGQSYVMFGHDGTWPSTLELSLLNSRVGVTINGIGLGDYSGHSVTLAGDVNGDGFDDVIIGAYRADPGNRTDASQSYVIFGGAEQFSNNQIEIQSGRFVRLNVSNLAVEPLIDNRNFTVSDVQHGRFAFASAPRVTITQFSQQQINNGDILFVHDGSDQAPGYTVSAEGITRVFSNVHPQRGNVSFIVSDAPTSAPTIMPTAIPTLAPLAIPTIAPTTVPTVAPSALPTFLPTVALIAVPTIAPTTVPSLNPTSFFGVPTDVPTIAPVSAPTVAPFSVSPTALINGVETAVTNDGGGDSDSGALVGGIAGGLIAAVALLLVGFFYYRRRQNEERKKLVQGVTGDEMRTVAMTLNPAFMAGANAPDTTASGEGVGDDPAAQYESPRLASRGTGGNALDEEHYVAQTGGTVIITGADGATYAVPMATDDGAAGIPAADNQYRVFRSVGADGGSEADPNAGSGNGNDTYHVFRDVSV